MFPRVDRGGVTAVDATRASASASVVAVGIAHGPAVGGFTRARFREDREPEAPSKETLQNRIRKLQCFLSGARQQVLSGMLSSARPKSGSLGLNLASGNSRVDPHVSRGTLPVGVRLKPVRRRLFDGFGGRPLPCFVTSFVFVGRVFGGKPRKKLGPRRNVKEIRRDGGPRVLEFSDGRKID